MKYDKEKDQYVFSSGRTRYSHAGIIGLDPNDLKAVHYGYDGGFWEHDEREGGWVDEPLTPTDLGELADHMIDAWQQFKERYGR